MLAWRHGWVLVINEFSAAPADLWVSCNDLLEGAPLDCDATAERIAPHPDTRVIITDNTRGHADIEEGLFGRQVQDRSVIDRFWHLRLEGLSEAEEAALLMKEVPEQFVNEFGAEMLKRLAEILARAGLDSRSRAENQQLGYETRNIALSHRVLRRLMLIILARCSDMTILTEGGVLAAARMAFTEALDGVSRQALETLLLTSLGRLDLKLLAAKAQVATDQAWQARFGAKEA